MKPPTWDVSELLREVRFRTSRSSGPGGQHVNKTETRVEVLWNPLTTRVFQKEEIEMILNRWTGHRTKDALLSVVSDRYRSQLDNKADAFEKLVVLIQRALHTEKPRKATKPSAAAKRKRAEAKTRHSERKAQRRWKPGD